MLDTHLDLPPITGQSLPELEKLNNHNYFQNYN